VKNSTKNQVQGKLHEVKGTAVFAALLRKRQEQVVS